jgi:hypothetical protein
MPYYMLYAFASAHPPAICPRMLLALSCDVIHYFLGGHSTTIATDDTFGQGKKNL